jgi:hypothetical protein
MVCLTVGLAKRVNFNGKWHVGPRAKDKQTAEQNAAGESHSQADHNNK